MPALASEDRLIPRSTLRYRPIRSGVKFTNPPSVPRASRLQTPSAEASATPLVDVSGKNSAKTWLLLWRQRQFLLNMALGMMVAILIVFIGQLLIAWIGTGLDDLHYGYPRTYQVDAVVGQNDSSAHPSHFIAVNLQGQIEVIEFPGGDASHAKVYLGPHLYGANASLVPVTLHFVDVQHNNQPDMIITFQGESLTFVNTNGSFHAPSGLL